MTEEAALIKVANRLFREGDFDGALRTYERFVRVHSSQAPKSLLASLQSNIDVCRTRRSRFAGLGEPAARNKVVLLVNPSHAHSAERAFWTDFARKFVAQGFQVIDLNFRKVEPFENVSTFIHPARMMDLGRKWPGLIDAPLPPWADERLLDLYTDWEHRRWQLDRYQSTVRDGCRATMAYIDHLVHALDPALIVTTNKIDPPNCFAYLAARHYGIDYRFAERSPVNTYLLEKQGMFQEAGTCEDVVSGLVSAAVQESGDAARASELIATIAGSPYGFRETEASRGSLDELQALVSGRPMFFLPLDNLLWTGWAQPEHPQGDIDYPILRDPEAALRAINQAVEKLGGVLVVKPHPSCKEWPRLRRACPDIVFTDADLDQLCDEAEVILTFLTKVAYLGLAKRKPVVSFGGGLLSRVGVTYEAKSELDLQQVLCEALQGKGLGVRLKRFEAVLPHLERRFYAYGGMAADACLEAVQPSATRPLTQKQVEAIVNERPGGNKRKIVLRCANGTPITPGRPIVVLDVSRLLNARLRRSGISRYIYSLALELLTSQYVGAVFAYVPQVNQYGMSAKIFNDLRKDMCCELVPMNVALPWLEARGEPFAYHSPVNPLPERVPGSMMRRILTIHDVFHLTRPDFYKAGNFITERVVGSLDLDADGVAFDSAYSMGDFEQHVGRLPRSARVVHLAVDHAFRYPAFSALEARYGDVLGDSRFVCVPFQGDPRKGFERMLGLGARWAAAGSDRKVAVFGKPDAKERVDQLLVEKGIDADRFVYLADLDDRQLAALYSRSIVQLYLSQAEGFGLPPMEAMASGCPSIVLANTSLAEVYEGWELLLANEADDDTILGIMERLTVDCAYRSSVGSRAKSFSDRFNWTSTANEMTAFYLDVIEEEAALPAAAMA